MSDTIELTDRQRHILEVIRTSTAEHGYPPSIREIGDAVGLASTSSVAHQLRALERKGVLRRNSNYPRALTLTDVAGFSGDDLLALARIAWDRGNELAETPHGYGYHWDEIDPETREEEAQAIKAVLEELDRRGLLKRDGDVAHQRHREALEHISALHIPERHSRRCWEMWPEDQVAWCHPCVAQYALDPWVDRGEA